MKQFLKLMFKRRSIIGSSRDTGWRVYEKFSGRVEVECIQPVFGGEFPLMRPLYLRSVFNKVIEVFLPESMCYIPKDNKYCAADGFEKTGDHNLLLYGWDEFVWKGEPFGFHLQGAQKDGTIKNHNDDMINLKKALSHFIKK